MKYRQVDEQGGGNRRGCRQFHPAFNIVTLYNNVTVKADWQEYVPEGYQTDSGKLTDNRAADSLRHGDVHSGIYDIPHLQELISATNVQL